MKIDFIKKELYLGQQIDIYSIFYTKQIYFYQVSSFYYFRLGLSLSRHPIPWKPKS